MLTKWPKPTRESLQRLPAAWLRGEELVSHLSLAFTEQIWLSWEGSVYVCVTHLWWNCMYVCPLQANTNSSSRQPCRSLGETLDSTSCVAGGSRFGYWLLTVSASSMMLWTDWRRYTVIMILFFIDGSWSNGLSLSSQLKEFANFDFDVWRKKYMRWMNHKKSRVMDFFRRIDKDQDGKITRQEFIDGILASSRHWLMCLISNNMDITDLI